MDHEEPRGSTPNAEGPPLSIADLKAMATSRFHYFHERRADEIESHAGHKERLKQIDAEILDAARMLGIPSGLRKPSAPKTKNSAPAPGPTHPAPTEKKKAPK